MDAIIAGAAAVLLLSTVCAIAFDSDVREGFLAVGWALLIGPAVMTWLGLALLLSHLPQRYRPRMVRGRRLSPRALQRVADRANTDGWMVSTRRGAIVVLKRKDKA